MELKKADETIHDQLINDYKAKSINELKEIVPRWAYGKNINKLLDGRQSPEENRNTICLAKISDLKALAEFQEVDCSSLFTGNRLNDSRVARILQRWENNLYVDPPSIYLSGKPKKIVFEDGRHRAKISCLLGFDQIPVAVAVEDFMEINDLLPLYESKI